MTAVLALDDVTRRFGPVEVLHGVDLTLNAGEVHALIGENVAATGALETTNAVTVFRHGAPSRAEVVGNDGRRSRGVLDDGVLVDVGRPVPEVAYVDRFLPAACPDFGRADRGESEENYGSSATCDIACLQALSRRIHFGKFVAESKFQSDPETYTRLIRAEDRAAIADSITNAAVEAQVLARLELKARTYGRDPSDSNADGPGKINAAAVVSMYKDFVIPLTKDVEVEYLMQRLD